MRADQKAVARYAEVDFGNLVAVRIAVQERVLAVGVRNLLACGVLDESCGMDDKPLFADDFARANDRRARGILSRDFAST